MKVLITGGLGFIGTHLANYYKTKNAQITLVDNLSTNVAPPPINSNDYQQFLNINLSQINSNELEKLTQTIKEADLIYHLASPVGVRHIDNNPQQLILNGHKINKNIFPILAKLQKKVIFLSSSEVYGETSNAKETDTLKIGSPETLRWGYACNKLMDEFLIKCYNFPHVIIRPFNITGRGQSHQFGMVLPSFIAAAQKNKNLVVYSNGRQTRSFCDIRDAVNMITLLGENDRHLGQIYNIGNPKNTITVQSLAKLVLEKIETTSQIENIPYEDSFSNQSKDIQYRTPNTEKISQFYTCKYNLTDTIESMIGQN